MEPGKLNCKVLIKRKVAGQDELGQPMQVWENLIATGDGKVWANIRYLNGVETIKADAQASVVKASIRIRRRVDVTDEMRVEYGTTTFEIKAVLPDEQTRERLDLACEVLK